MGGRRRNIGPMAIADSAGQTNRSQKMCFSCVQSTVKKRKHGSFEEGRKIKKASGIPSMEVSQKSRKNFWRKCPSLFTFFISFFLALNDSLITLLLWITYLNFCAYVAISALDPEYLGYFSKNSGTDKLSRRMKVKVVLITTRRSLLWPWSRFLALEFQKT